MRSATRMLAAVGTALALLAAGAAGSGTSGLPARLDSYLAREIRLSAEQLRDLLAGAPVTKLLDADEREEVGVFGAVWIDAPLRRYVDAVLDIERFERGSSFRTTARIGSPPALEDFAALRLPADTVKDLRKCRVGDCVVKLDEPTIRTLRQEVPWASGDPQTTVDAVMRRFALDYVTGYLEGGNARLAVYRDGERPIAVADELRPLIDDLPDLSESIADVRKYLLEFPAPNADPAASLLYWQEADFGLRPTIRISHLTVWESPHDTVVASKMLYASHYFRAALELRVLIPDPSRGAGFWFITVNRSRTDGLTGLTGRMIKGRVRREVQKGALAALRATRGRLESSR